MLERATQKRDGASQLLWFDTGGGETTDASKTGIPVLVAGTASQVYVDLAFNKVLTPFGRDELANGGFGEYVPSGDTGGGWTSSNVDEAGGWRVGGTFILNSNGTATNPTLTQSLGAIRAGVTYQVSGRFQVHAGGAADATAGFQVALSGAALSAVVYGAPDAQGWRTFTATFTGGAGLHTLSLAGEVGNDISYRVDGVAVQAANVVSYITKFGDPASTALYIDASGRKVATAAGNRPSVIPVDDVELSPFTRVRDVVVPGGGVDRLIVESSSTTAGLDVVLDTYYVPVHLLTAGMPVTYGDGIASYHLPANRVGKRYFGGEVVRDPFTGAVLTYQAGDDLTVYDLFNPVRTPCSTRSATRCSTSWGTPSATSPATRSSTASVSTSPGSAASRSPTSGSTRSSRARRASSTAPARSSSTTAASSSTTSSRRSTAAPRTSAAPASSPSTTATRTRTTRRRRSRGRPGSRRTPCST